MSTSNNGHLIHDVAPINETTKNKPHGALGVADKIRLGIKRASAAARHVNKHDTTERDEEELQSMYSRFKYRD